jgi:hypothetical protein
MSTPVISLAALLERFFTQRLMQQRQASPDGTPGRYKPGDRLLAFLNSL